MDLVQGSRLSAASEGMDLVQDSQLSVARRVQNLCLWPARNLVPANVFFTYMLHCYMLHCSFLMLAPINVMGNVNTIVWNNRTCTQSLSLTNDIFYCVIDGIYSTQTVNQAVLN